ncbi:hypothetical protein GCM10009122_16590 [Fulvivirga kasyanovii]
MVLVSFIAVHIYAQEDHAILSLKKSLDTSHDDFEHVCYQIGLLYTNQVKYDSATHYFKKGLSGYLAKKNDAGVASMHNLLGVTYYKTGNLDSSIYHYKKANDYYNSQNDTLNIARTELNLGIIYKDLGAYSFSLEYLLLAVRKLEMGNDSSTLASCYNSIASAYSRQDDLARAITYHKKSLSIRRFLNDQKGIATSLNNLGIVYRKLDDYDSALYYYKESLKIKEQLKDYSKVASTLNNIGTVMFDLKRFEEAKGYFEQAHRIRPTNADRNGQSTTFNNLGNIYTSLHQPQKALLYLDSAQALIKEGGFLSEMEDNLNFRMLAYEQLGRYDKSLECARELMVIRDSLLNSDKVQRLIEMQTKYETEKKEQSIAMLETERELQKAEIDLSRLWIIILGISVVLVFVIGLSIYTKFRSESRNKKQIQLLMQELHHRVKNNLQLLSNIFSLQSRTITDAGALEAVRSGENRINAMAIIHQKLYKKTESRSVNIHDYLGDLISQLADSYGYDQMQNDSIEVDIQPVELDVDKVIPIGLIVNELVSNSFKYAFPVTENPELKVILHLEKDQLHLCIEDNGPGFSKPDKFESSMGLNIIETLSRQLNATIKWETSNKTKLNLLMPLK